MSTDSLLSIENVTKAYGHAGEHVILENLTLDVRRSELVSIVGPSGIGKTTLLKSIAGLHQVTSGQVVVNGRKVTGPPREMALVFQDYSRSLMPWLTVQRNVAMPLRRMGLSKAEIKERVDEALVAVNVADSSGKYPWQLSGGMQQRVAIARAVAYQPEVLVMDEPFASVDAQTRFDLEDLTLRIRQDFGMTVLLVTHDIDEAVYMSDRVAILGGRPASVREVIDIPLPRPRDQHSTRILPEFGELRTYVLDKIRNQ